MTAEAPIFHQDKTLLSAVYRPQDHKRLMIALDGFQVVFGLPPIKAHETGTYLTIPSSPHIFRINALTFITQKPNYEHSFTLYDQVVFLCHGKRDHESPLDWELADGQSPFDLVQKINDPANGFPRVNALISCRSIVPEISRRHYRHPLGWSSVPGVIFQKAGRLDFLAKLEGDRITARVTSKQSDFYRPDKHGKLINLRKIYH